MRGALVHVRGARVHVRGALVHACDVQVHALLDVKALAMLTHTPNKLSALFSSGC